MTKTELRGLIERVIAETNLSLPAERQLGTYDDSPLIGEGGLDSLGLITFLVSLEDALESATAQRLMIVDENELGSLDGVYKNAGSLVNFVGDLARESGLLND